MSAARSGEAASVSGGLAVPAVVAAPAAASGTAGGTTRPLLALGGIFLAAMMAGLNNRVGTLALADVRGALGFGLDDASWLGTAYAAGELVAMPFASWFAITLTLRRFHLGLLLASVAVALLLPWVRDLHLLLALRALQGLACGAMIPLLMSAALRFLPAPVRLHGLALYAMTATFAPNVAMWLAAQWTDALHDWRLVYWQIVPLAAIAGALVARGLPREPIQAGRFPRGNWLGLACGATGLALLAVGLDQGVRLDWFRSPLVTCALAAGAGCTALYLLTEWYHPEPFMELRLLARRNLGLGFAVFVCLLVVMLSGSALPSGFLARTWGYRALQGMPIGLIVGLPQMVLGSLVALLLYRRWVDARWVFACGLALLALSCLLAARLTPDWMWRQFAWVQVLQALGQPMTVVPLLFLATSVVRPQEGPYVSGIINALRVFGTLLGGAGLGQFLAVRERFHTSLLLDHVGRLGGALGDAPLPAGLGGMVARQAFVLATADAYRVLGWFALALIPVVLRLQYIPAPTVAAPR